MIIDLDDLGTTEIAADLCVVGSGPAGLAIANRFLDEKLRVVVFESGPAAGTGPESSLDRAEVLGLPFDGAVKGRHRGFGGAGTLWAGLCLRMEDAELRPRSWVPRSGWPLTADELAPWYRRAETFLEVDGHPTDESVYGRFRLAPLGFDDERLRLINTVYAPRPDLGARLRRRLRRAATTTIVTRATVTHVALREDGRVAHVHARSLGGAEVRVAPRVVVLAAGGIENARLLLVSARQPDGHRLDEHGMVGRCLQDHPNAFTATVVSPPSTVLPDHFGLLYRRRHRFWPKVTLTDALQEREQVLNATASLSFGFGPGSSVESAKRIHRSVRAVSLPRELGAEARTLARGIPDLAQLAQRRYRYGLSPAGRDPLIRLQVVSEQVPDPTSTVGLDPTSFDDLGQPRAAINWRLGELERRTFQVATDAVREEFRRLGLGAVIADDWLDDADWDGRLVDCNHHIGTTRMSSTPRDGVVDSEGRVHGVPNLFIAGSSVFPTSGHANPTLTIVALAMRLAEHLRSILARPGP